MKWTFWKATEDYIHITPIIAFLNDEEGFYMKLGWLRWRCGFVIYKEEK